MTTKDRKRIRKLHALLGSSNEGEREAARRKLEALLTRLGKSWNDLPELLTDDTPAQPVADPRDSGPHPFDRPDAPTPADTVRRMLELYLRLEPYEYVAVALWIIHTHTYDRFMVTPRLLLSSPVKGCGKTTLLDVAERLVVRAEKSDNITAAAIYHSLQGVPRTLLLDEADNLEMSTSAARRAQCWLPARRCCHPHAAQPAGSISSVCPGGAGRDRDADPATDQSLHHNPHAAR
jgi:DNA polymerase III delta prime subunit